MELYSLTFFFVFLSHELFWSGSLSPLHIIPFYEFVGFLGHIHGLLSHSADLNVIGPFWSFCVVYHPWTIFISETFKPITKGLPLICRGIISEGEIEYCEIYDSHSQELRFWVKTVNIVNIHVYNILKTFLSSCWYLTKKLSTQWFWARRPLNYWPKSLAICIRADSISHY